MTKEEALRHLNAMKICTECQIKSKLSVCDDCRWQYESGTMGEIVQTLDMAINMLNTEPKAMSVILHGDGYANGELVYDVVECPACCYELTDDYDPEYQYEPYCPHCGQKLNWNVGETE